MAVLSFRTRIDSRGGTCHLHAGHLLPSEISHGCEYGSLWKASLSFSASRNLPHLRKAVFLAPRRDLPLLLRRHQLRFLLRPRQLFCAVIRHMFLCSTILGHTLKWSFFPWLLTRIFLHEKRINDVPVPTKE